MAEDIDGALGVRATIDASDVYQEANKFVESITMMQTETSKSVSSMNSTLNSLSLEVYSFGRSVNGLSLSELNSQLDKSKAAFVSLSDDIRLQKNIIKETAADLGDLQRAYQEAKNAGKTLAADDMLKQIEMYKQGLAEQRRELADMITQQQTERDKISELTQSYNELQNSQPTFENVVNGSKDATTQVAELQASFENFLATYKEVQQGVTELSQQSAASLSTGKQGEAFVDTITSSPNAPTEIEGLGTTKQAVEQTMQDIENAYALSTASAETALTKQSDLISMLEGRIIDLKSVMQDAMSSGNTEAATAAQVQINNLTEELNKAKDTYSELAKQADTSNTALSKFSVGQNVEETTQKIETMKSSFQDFMDTYKNSNVDVDKLKGQGSEILSTGDKLQKEANFQLSTRSILESKDETAKAVNSIKGLMSEANSAYTNSAATAKVAFTQQQQVVKDLETKIKDVQGVLSSATKSGNMDVAKEAATQLVSLEQELTKSKGKLSELQSQSQEASLRLADFQQKSNDVTSALEQQSTTWGRYKYNVKQMGQTIGGWFSSQVDKGKAAASQFTNMIDGMGIPLSNGIKGLKGFIAASRAFIATPLGAVLGVIVLALKAVHTYLNKSAEGQKTMAKISAFLSSILGSLTDIVIAFGKYLFKTFSGSNQAVNLFAKNFVSTLVSAFNTVKNTVVAFSSVFKGMWQIMQGNFSEGWDLIKSSAANFTKAGEEFRKAFVGSLNSAWNGIKASWSVISGLFNDKELRKDLNKAVTNILPNAIKSSRAAGKQADLYSEKYEANNRASKLDDEIAQSREKIYTLTGKAKEEEIKHAKELLKQKFYGRDIIDQKTKQVKHEKGLLDIQKEQVKNLKEKNGLHTKSLKDIKAERDANLKLLQMQVQASASTRMLTRMEAANQRSMASKAKSAAKSNINKNNAVISARDKYDQVLDTNDEARLKEATSLEEKITQARIEAIVDGYERTRDAKQEQNKKELEDIRTQQEEAIKAEKKRQKAEFDAKQQIIKAQGDKIRKWNEEKDLNKEPINNINNQYDSLYNYTEQKQTREDYDTLSKEYDKNETQKKDKINKLKSDIAQLTDMLKKATSETDKANLLNLKKNAEAQLEWVQSSADAWNSYYTQYGTFIEKKKALEEKFAHDTQGLDKNSAEYKTLQKQLEKSIQNLNLKEIKKQLNWEDVFGDFGKMSKVALSTLQHQLESLIKGGKDLSIESIKELNNALKKVRTEQSSRGSLIANVFGSLKNLRKKQTAYNSSQKEIKNTSSNLWKQYLSATTAEEKDTIRNKMVYDPTTQKLKKFGDVIDRATKATENLSDAQKTSQNSIRSLGKGFTTISTAGKDVSNMLEKFGVKMPDGLEQMYDGLGEIGGALDDFDITHIDSFLDIGNYIHAVTGVVSGVTDFFAGALKLFGIGKGNMEDYEKAVKQYEKLDKIWTSLISKKKEYLSMSYGEEARQVGKEYIELAQADLNATKTLANQFLGAWQRGSHSQGYKFDQKMRKGIKGVTWSDISSTLGFNVDEIRDLTDLSYKQLEKLKTQYTEWWVEMPEDYRNYLDSIIDKQNTLEDAQDEVLEKLTGVKFDDMYSNFMSALSDMSKGADDFVKDFKTKMLTALIENTMGDKVKEWTQDFVKRYQQAVKDANGKISDATAQQFKEELSEASNTFFNEREEIANSIGMGSNSSDNTSQKNGYATASEESIEELSGRALAQTEALYSIRDQQLVDSSQISGICDNLNLIVTIENNRTTYYDESIEIQRTSVGHLATIAKNTNELYVMNERLDKIERNTRNL